MPGVIQILGANDIPHGGVNNWYDSSATCVEPVSVAKPIETLMLLC